MSRQNAWVNVRNLPDGAEQFHLPSRRLRLVKGDGIVVFYKLFFCSLQGKNLRQALIPFIGIRLTVLTSPAFFLTMPFACQRSSFCCVSLLVVFFSPSFSLRVSPPASTFVFVFGGESQMPWAEKASQPHLRTFKRVNEIHRDQASIASR